MAAYMVVLLGVVLAMFSRVLGIVPSSNNTGGLHVILQNQAVVIKFAPNLIEGLVERQTAKIFYALESDLPAVATASQGPTSSEPSLTSVTLFVKSRDAHISTVETPSRFTVEHEPNDFNVSFISIKGQFLGRTVLTFSVADAELASSYSARDPNPSTGPPGPNGEGHPTTSNTTGGVNSPYTQTTLHISRHAERKVLDFEYHISVVREHRVVDSIFLIVIVLIIVAANIGMGCKIDMQVIREVIRRPVAPAIGMSCQYLIMPLLCFALIKALGLQGGVALGMFATGCAPGGGASNMYAFLLRGDLSLSVTMTFFSTMAALGLIPFWLFTLGRLILDVDDSSRIRIPYMNIIYSLLLILIPVGVGIAIQRFRPVWSKHIIKTLRPVFCFFIIFVFTFGVYVNYFIFSLFTMRLVVAGVLLPYVGFILGGLIALVSCQSWARIKTIAVETGIQNTGVAFLVVTFTLPQPEADLALVSPVIVSTFTPIPLLIGIALYEYRNRCAKPAPGDAMATGLQTPITEEATFEQLDQKQPLNGNGATIAESQFSERHRSKQSHAELVPMDDHVNSAI